MKYLIETNKTLKINGIQIKGNAVIEDANYKIEITQKQTKTKQIKRRAKQHRWTNQEVSQLLDLVEKGYKPKEIAKRMNLKPKIIQNKICRIRAESKR